MREQWNGFIGGIWEDTIDVALFIRKNYTPYTGTGAFLAGATQDTRVLWERVCAMEREERTLGHALDMDTRVVSTLTSHDAGYIDRPREKIVGLQTDKPFKRALMPCGGIRMATAACRDNGFEIDGEVARFFTEHRKTHNAGVYDVYTPEMRACRSNHIITGLPDAYGRGRIIGDYRRVPLYGADILIAAKEAEKACTGGVMSEDVIRAREEIAEQIRALGELKKMAQMYGVDISHPARNTQEAVQFLYFAYLGAVKEQNGAAMSLGRTSTFLDIYAERDLKNGLCTEEEIQELVDQFVMKLRLVKFARTPEYNNLFAGDPTWVTESIGGMGDDGRTMVTKMSYRYLHTLDNLGSAPEPNMTVLWSTRLPENFKHFCADISVRHCAIQYENDDLMRPVHGDDYGIACCVSSMRIGKEMQFFGARANLAKCLLYAINGGVDEMRRVQVAPPFTAVSGDVLEYEDVMARYRNMMEWLAGVYVNTLNVIHYMHDKYCYERLQMALHDCHVRRWFATGIAGLSVVADSLSAIRYAKVHVIRDQTGFITGYRTEGDFPKYGNDDDRVDAMAVEVLHTFLDCVRKHQTYRGSIPTTSVLTITSNVAYGKNTGATPDGRAAGEPFAPGANPMHGRDASGAVASLCSVAKLRFSDAQDGISNTFSVTPSTLGKGESARRNLVSLLDGYMEKGGQHLNVNVFNREQLLDAQAHPEKYPQLTVRVSGYAVHFVKLTREQQDEVIRRTFHERL